MKKENIIAIFDTDLNDPGAIKSGEYLEEHVLMHAQEIVRQERPALIEVLTDWVVLREEPQTMLAVRIAKSLHLHELRNVLLALRKDVVSGRVFLPFYVKWIDEALNAMGRENVKNGP